MNGDEIARRDLVQNDMLEHVLEPEMSPESRSRMGRHAVEPALVKLLGVEQTRHPSVHVATNGLVHPEQHGYLAALAHRMQFIPMLPHPCIDFGLLLINRPKPRGSAHFEGVDFRNPLTLRAMPLVKLAQ